MLVALLLPLVVHAATVVVVPLSALAPAEPPERLAPPVPALVDALEVRIDLPPAPEDAAHVPVVLTWGLSGLDEGWVDLPLVGVDLAARWATLDGAPVALAPQPDGMRHFVGRLSGRHTLVLGGSLAAVERQVGLDLAPAARTSVIVEGEGWDALVDGGLGTAPGERGLPPTGRVTVSWRPAIPPFSRPLVVRAESATALAVDSSGTAGRTVIRYTLSNGSADALRFRVTGGIDALEVQGPGVVGHRREGDEVLVQLAAPVEGTATLTVGFRAPPPAGEAPAPAPLVVPVAERSAGWISLSVADSSILVLSPGPGLEPAGERQLPNWARGLVAGTPVAAYRSETGDPKLDWLLLSSVPVDEPPTLVDEARIEVASAEHGGTLVRARYQVRNDRNQYLALTLPAGLHPLGARVAGRVVQPVLAADGRLLLPLEKSVETLDGLVSFPVELILLGHAAGWDRRGERRVETPAVDAPVAYARVELILPPGFEARDRGGSATPVVAWSDREGGIAYGRATGGRGQQGQDADDPTRIDQDRRETTSVELWNQAYGAYKDNRFDEARGLLDQSLAYDPDNRAAQALQSNVAVLLGGVSEGNDEAAATGDDLALESRSRRIRELARARTLDKEVEQDQLDEEAGRNLRAGDYETAARQLRDLVELTEDLAVVEQEEAWDQKGRLEDYRRQLDEVERKAAEKRQADAPAAGKPDETVRTGERAAILVEESLVEGAVPFEPPVLPEPDSGEVAIIFDEGVGGGYALDGASVTARPSVDAAAPARRASLELPKLALKSTRAPASPTNPEPPPRFTTMTVIPVSVTASALTVLPPRAGTSLLYEQRLVAAGAPVTIDVRYRGRPAR